MSAKETSLLSRLGWTPDRERSFAPHAADGLEPARVAVEHRGAYVLYTARGERPAEAAGRLRHLADSRAELPAVGDWVAIALRDCVGDGINPVPKAVPTAERALVQAVLPRRTVFSRMAASDQGRVAEEQVVAANVDVLFLVAGLDGDLNLRRLERYLTLAWESGAQPVAVLTKADLCPDVAEAVLGVEAVAIGVPVHAVSNVTGEGLDGLRPYFDGNRTVAALGSSGVGKSTLVNRLTGEELMETGDLRRDGRGRHTTTNRQLLLLPGGGLFLDTPGMRELRLWESEDGLDAAFDDVTSVAAGCRFSDCNHETEPGCAVREALAPVRFASWRKLQNELEHLARKQGARLQAEARKERRRLARSRRKTAW